MINDEDSFDQIIVPHQSNDSIKFITKMMTTNTNTFCFKEVEVEDVEKKLKRLNGKKATGYDGFPPKLIKMGANVLSGPLHYLVNMTIKHPSFQHV